MSQDWMKVEKATPSKPKIIRIGRMVGISRHDAFGKCFDVWQHFDTHSTDGFLEFLDAEWLDKFVDRKGFAAAMESVGWLEITNDGLRLPHFDEHCSETAKTRALDRSRKGKKRGKKTEGTPQMSGEMSGKNPDNLRTKDGTEEIRREKEIKESFFQKLENAKAMAATLLKIGKISQVEFDSRIAEIESKIEAEKDLR